MRRMKDPEKFFGIAFTAVGGLVILLQLAVLIMSMSAEGVCIKAQRTPKHNYNVYQYEVDGESYTKKINCGKHNKTHVGDTKTIRCLKSHPTVTYDGTLMIFAVFFAGCGVLLLRSRFSSDDDNGYA